MITPHSTLNTSHLIGAVVFQALGDLHNTGSAQTGSAQFDELLSILQGRNAAGGLDLHMGSHMLCKQFHIGKGGAGLGEAGGGLDVIGAGIGNALAQGDLFFVRQQAGLDDDL